MFGGATQHFPRRNSTHLKRRFVNEDQKDYLKQPYYTPIPLFCLEVENFPLTPPPTLDIISIDKMSYPARKAGSLKKTLPKPTISQEKTLEIIFSWLQRRMLQTSTEPT
jgi:hypothetical protein